MTTTTGVSLTEEIYDHRVDFADELVHLATDNDRIVVVCNDSVGSSKLGDFRERFPSRLINVGIAEQNMVGVGTGLASAGMIPFVCSAGPFLTGRALEQIKADVAYSQHPVILCGMSPGVAYGALGPTHHSIEDLSWLRALPGLDIIVPADRQQTRATLRQLVDEPRPTYLRVGRTKTPDLVGAPAQLERGAIQVLDDEPDTDIALVGLGGTVAIAVRAAQLLRESGRPVAVYNAGYLAPLDERAADALRRYRAVVTIEEANVSGGLGAAIASLLAAEPDAPIVRQHGFRTFAQTGESDQLFADAGLTTDSVVTTVQEMRSS